MYLKLHHALNLSVIEIFYKINLSRVLNLYFEMNQITLFPSFQWLIFIKSYDSRCTCVQIYATMCSGWKNVKLT